MNKDTNTPLSTEEVQNIELRDDLELLDLMLTDSKSHPPIYLPTPYWATKAKVAANEIKKYGITDFRGSSNLIGLSYADNLYVDIRNAYNHGLRKLALWLTKIFPVSIIYNSQVQWTEAYAKESVTHIQEILNKTEKTRDLLKKYTIPYSLLGKCLRKAKIDGNEYSTLYINTLEQHDNIASHIKFNDVHSVFEIGGGFGTNVHLLLENYKNIKKILYLDITPNLYVGTQYLKAFYGDAVFDYRALKNLDSIKFSSDDSLEIFCIAPWQIENFESSVDVFMNSHSFVEMANNVVNNYAEKFDGFPDSKNTAIALTTYDGFDLNTTSDPSELPKYFKDREFSSFEAGTLLNSSRKNLFFVSPGKFGFDKGD